MENNILLDVKGLKTYFHTFKGVVKAVDDVSFSLKEGEILGIVGESGSGKSVTSFSILKLVEEPGVVEAEQILFDGRDLSRASDCLLYTSCNMTSWALFSVSLIR